MTVNSSGSSYGDAIQSLDQMGTAVRNLLEQLLVENNIMTRDVQVRVKSRQSVVDKMDRNPDKYTEPNTLTDLLGIRVTAYFSDDVDRIAQLFVSEFEIDPANSVDKRATLSEKEFGYASLHFVAKLSTSRIQFLEYKNFAGKSFELQIRSVLQDAWAEIEHDLGYKTDESLPREMRRRFSRLAGLLELADDEFVSLRSALESHASDVVSRVANVNESESEPMSLDQTTVLALIESDSDLSSIDHRIATALHVELAESAAGKYAAARSLGLRSVGVGTLDDLRSRLIERSDNLEAFAAKWLEATAGTIGGRELPRGIGLFYLELALLAETPQAELEASQRFSTRPGIAALLVATWKSTKDAS